MGYHLSSSGDLLDPGIEPMSLSSPALEGGLFPTNTIWEAPCLSARYSQYLKTSFTIFPLFVLYFLDMILVYKGFPGGSVAKNLPAIQEIEVQFLDGKDPLEIWEWQSTSVFLDRKPHAPSGYNSP